MLCGSRVLVSLSVCELLKQSLYRHFDDVLTLCSMFMIFVRIVFVQTI